MKQVQGAFFSGYVNIVVKGKLPELFFQRCSRQGITVWNIRKTGSERCEGNIKLSDVQKVRKLIRGTDYKLSFTTRKGYPFLFKGFISKKPLLIGLILAIFLIFYLSNIVWSVKITGVPIEIEEKISKELNNYGVHPGAWIHSLDSPNDIQQKLVSDVPELLWVGVKQNGTTYYLEGVEKLIVKEEESNDPRNLVATKKGVISNMYVAKGLPMVQVNDYVEPGDILVSGVIGEKEEEENEENEEKEKRKNVDMVAAEGEIMAKTWYEVDVTAPLKYHYEEITGNKKEKYYISIRDFHVPIWGFGSTSYNEIHREVQKTPIQLLKWSLPIDVVNVELNEKKILTGERTKEEAIQAGIEQAKSDLLLKLGPDARILSEKVLHESMEHGKVKLTLYITAEEKIARVQPINQGD